MATVFAGRSVYKENGAMKTDYQTIKVRVKDDVVVLTIDNPPVNQMSPQLMLDFSDAVREAAENGQVKAVVLTGTGKKKSV
jgi:enoyl-CoA hydratase/carnithine racemase